MNREYTEEELKKIEESKRLNKIISPVIGLVIGTICISIFMDNIVFGIIGGVFIAEVIFWAVSRRSRNNR